MSDIKAELFRLAHLGDLDALKHFVEKNFGDADKTWMDLYHNKSGDTVLHLSVRFGHLDVLRWLSEEQSADLEQANLDAKRALHEAAQHSQLPCLQYLLDRGVAVDPLKRADWTPLMLACTKLDLPVIRALVAARADPRLCNKDGWNSFHVACREGSVDIICFFLDRDSEIWDSASKNGRTPLHTAALHGCEEAVRLLLDRCAFPPDTRDSCGTTPLMDALRAGHTRTAQLLIDKHGADVAAEDGVGRRPLHLAAQAGAEVSVRFLLDVCGVHVGVKSSLSGVTPLHVAAKEGQEKMLEFLVTRGADVNAVDNKGRTALHIACGNQFTNCVKILLHYGARDTRENSGVFASELVVVQSLKELSVESYRSEAKS